MKKMVPPSPPSVNMLQDIHARLTQLPIFFRERVCEECSWSIPTFYRKMRSIDKAPAGRKAGPALSNAEKEKVIAVLDEVFQELWDYYDKYRKHPRR